MRRRLGLMVLGVAIAGALVYWGLDQRSQADALAMQIDAIADELAAMEKQAPPAPVAPVPRQWLVLESQAHFGPQVATFTITYIGPTGETQTWRRDMTEASWEYGADTRQCWESVRLGSVLPQCARSGY